MSLDEFMQDARYQLSESDFDQLEALDIQRLNYAGGMGNLKSAIDLFEDLETDKQEIRLAKKQSRKPNVLTLPQRADEKNPLELEKLFMKSLWDGLDSIEVMEHFTLTEVFTYKLKLQILERLNSFDTDKGLEILERVVHPSTENMEV
jgi:hypothetical protein